MVPQKDEPLQCRLFPGKAYRYSSHSHYAFEKDLVQSLCDSMVEMALRKLGGKLVERCFEDGPIDATRVYDDCVSEVCACQEKNVALCSPAQAFALLESACAKNGVSF